MLLRIASLANCHWMIDDHFFCITMVGILTLKWQQHFRTFAWDDGWIENLSIDTYACMHDQMAAYIVTTVLILLITFVFRKLTKMDVERDNETDYISILHDGNEYSQDKDKGGVWSPPQK